MVLNNFHTLLHYNFNSLHDQKAWYIHNYKNKYKVKATNKLLSYVLKS